MRMEYEKVELVMRIISQDGRIDLPYEKVCLYIDSTRRKHDVCNS